MSKECDSSAMGAGTIVSIAANFVQALVLAGLAWRSYSMRATEKHRVQCEFTETTNPDGTKTVHRKLDVSLAAKKHKQETSAFINTKNLTETKGPLLEDAPTTGFLKEKSVVLTVQYATQAVEAETKEERDEGQNKLVKLVANSARTAAQATFTDAKNRIIAEKEFVSESKPIPIHLSDVSEAITRREHDKHFSSDLNSDSVINVAPAHNVSGEHTETLSQIDGV